MLKKIIALGILLAFILAICLMCTVYFFDLYVEVTQPGLVMDDPTRAYLAELMTEAIMCLLASIACIACAIIILIDYKKIDSVIQQVRSSMKIKATQKAETKKQARIAKLEEELEQLKKDE